MEVSKFDKSVEKMGKLINDYYKMSNEIQNKCSDLATYNALMKFLKNYMTTRMVIAAQELISAANAEKPMQPKELKDFLDCLPF